MIRPVFTIGPSPEARAIRDEVFCKEQGYSCEFDDLDATSVSLVLYLDGEAIATGRLVKIDPSQYQIGRVAVRKAYRGRQIGSYLMRFLCKKARELGARTCLVHAQVERASFYTRLGFRTIGDGEIDYEEGHPHVYMVRDAY